MTRLANSAGVDRAEKRGAAGVQQSNRVPTRDHSHDGVQE
jgi:hypothetical protein